MSDEFFGSYLLLTGEVKYIGEGEDPAQCLYFNIWKDALKEFFSKEKK